MIDPAHQRKGLGRMLTDRCSEVADRLGVETWVRARPRAASLFFKEGYEVMRRIDFDLADFGAEGKTAVFVMKREPFARKDAGRRLDIDGLA